MSLSVFILRGVIGLIVVLALLALLHLHVTVAWDKAGSFSPISWQR